MKKFLLAYNPVSGDAMFKKKLDDIINQFQSRDCIIMPYRTKKKVLINFSLIAYAM